MNLLKSLFITLYIAAGLGGFIAGLVMVGNDGWTSPWLGTVLACAGPTFFFSRIMLMPRARTSARLRTVIAAGAAGSFLSLTLPGAWSTAAVAIAVGVGLIGSLAYVFWYSRFGAPANAALSEGDLLPAFELTEHGRRFDTAELTVKPALWIFYRGNWCPLCVAQIREIAAQYRELARRGVAVHLVSPQSEANSQQLAKQMDAPMRFLTDDGNRAAAVLGIGIEDGLPAGLQALGYDSDVPRPTVFITAAGGRILHCDMTDNYRVRPEPASFFGVLDRHSIV